MQPVDQPEPLPLFAQQILAMTDEVNIPYQNDWQLGVTTRTLYLNHHIAPRCDVFRLLQLVGDADTWLRQILNVWHDRIVPGDHFVVHLVGRSPPRGDSDQHIAVDLILSQGLTSECFSGLGTVCFNDDLRGDRRFSVAASLPPLLSGIELADRLDVTELCLQHGCNLLHRWTELTLTPVVGHRMSAGDFSLVFVHPNDADMPPGPNEDDRHGNEFDNDYSNTGGDYCNGNQSPSYEPFLAAGSPVDDQQAAPTWAS